MTTSDGLGEIGFSGGVLEQRPTKVKATVANIPVLTESLVQQQSSLQSMIPFCLCSFPLKVHLSFTHIQRCLVTLTVCFLLISAMKGTVQQQLAKSRGTPPKISRQVTPLPVIRSSPAHGVASSVSVVTISTTPQPQQPQGNAPVTASTPPSIRATSGVDFNTAGMTVSSEKEESTEGTAESEEEDGRKERACKGKRYKDLVAQNAFTKFQRKDKKVGLSPYPILILSL